MTSRVIGFIVCPKGTGEPEIGSPVGKELICLFGTSGRCWSRGCLPLFTGEFADGRETIFDQNTRAEDQE